ncbi:MAG TPA: hypothetical protein VNZ44_14680 [Pyrinomonadaceae bacterium]|nr:hypothetical protein [Pyrinomonadaceae bacterium]
MRTVKTRGLPGGVHAERVYTFLLDERSRPAVLHVPGEARGPDVCIPEFAEQEEWLGGLTKLLTHTWDCQWTFADDDAVAAFLLLLKPLEVARAEGV